MNQLEKTNIQMNEAMAPQRLKSELICRTRVITNRYPVTTLIWSVSSAEKAIPNVYLSEREAAQIRCMVGGMCVLPC